MVAVFYANEVSRTRFDLSIAWRSDLFTFNLCIKYGLFDFTM